MKGLMTLFGSSMRKFHDDEEGMETLQVVMILAISAIVAVFIFTMWDKISAWAKELIDKILNRKSEG